MMSLETNTSSETVSESVAETSTATESPDESTSSSGYSMTDPGYDAGDIEPVEDELAALKAENQPKNPSETSDDASVDTDPEEAAETPTDEAVDSDEISDELLDRAFELGYTLDEMKQFTDAKALEAEVSRVERINKRLQERQGSKTAPAEDPLPPEEFKEPDWDAMIEQGHDPEIIAMQKHSWKRAAVAEALARKVIQTEQIRAFNAQCDRFDDVLSGMEGFESILGTGRRDELKQSPELVKNRQKVFTKMQVLRRGYEEAGEKVPAEKELIQEAVQASFYKHAQQTAREKLKGDIKKASSQALSRPNSGGSKPVTGADRALQKEQEFWRNRTV
jgi:hypothetical protein